MKQQAHWDAEYTDPKFMTGGKKPQAAILRFLRTIKKQRRFQIDGAQIIDFGCGTGRAAVYMASHGAQVYGFDPSRTAITQAQSYAQEEELQTNVDLHTETWTKTSTIPAHDSTIDCVVMNMVFHLLDQEARAQAIKEITRVLKPGGFFYIRTLALEGDANARKLIAEFPAPNDPQGYHMPEFGYTEHPFTEEELHLALSPFYTMLEKRKTTAHPHVQGKIYKRKYWELIAQKAV